MNRPAINLKTRYLYLSNQLRRWLYNPKANSTAFIISLLGFIGACFLVWLIINHHQNQQSQLIDAYGNALNQLATNQLKVSMGNNNLIGLQSTLNDLIDQSKVINAIVYGVDNKIIVQAGDANRLHSISYKAYTSPITLDNALLGSLTINVDNSGTNNSWLSLVLLALVASLLFVLLHKIVRNTSSPKNTDNQNDTTNASIQAAIPIAPLIEKPTHQALLLLQCHTLDKLYQQLNAEARYRELEKLKLATKRVLTLYTGEQVAATPDTLLISFEGKDKKDCLLNALYCAYLLQQTSKQQQWLIGFSSFIYDKHDCVTVDHLSQLKSLYQEHDEPLITLKRDTMNESNLSDQINFNSSQTPDYIYITGFSDTYENLLKKQLARIT